MRRIYTLKQGVKTLSLNHKNRPYIIGFQTPIIARNVHYTIHPEPSPIFIHIDKENENIGLLIIQKCRGSIHEPMNDGRFHMSQIDYDTFIDLPIKNNLGIVLPYNIQHETEKEIAMRSFIFEAINNPRLFEPM